jgi:hypothetical protein
VSSTEYTHGTPEGEGPPSRIQYFCACERRHKPRCHRPAQGSWHHYLSLAYVDTSPLYYPKFSDDHCCALRSEGSEPRTNTRVASTRMPAFIGLPKILNSPLITTHIRL